ncbi:MAG: hypothetical protein E7604_06120 [Ruminococcaceae bacterium]|nr:hypothetical protein [Oscillospiraceae bacterium]
MLRYVMGSMRASDPQAAGSHTFSDCSFSSDPTEKHRTAPYFESTVCRQSATAAILCMYLTDVSD